MSRLQARYKRRVASGMFGALPAALDAASRRNMHEHILVVDDDIDTAVLACEGLRKRGFNARAVSSAEECLGRLGSSDVDLVITDVHMAMVSGIELCRRIAQAHPDTLSIVITGETGLETAIAAMRAGAYDYITKPLKIDVLAVAVARAVDHVQLRNELHALRSSASADHGRHGIAGASTAIRETVDMVERVASSEATVLITGESGTGKELVARALHDLSDRRDQPFVAINCGAMPAPLLESELFGHVRGAFTDAKQARPGLFAQAGSGTIFLDEIGEMPSEMQVKLLRVLQERSVRPVGGDEEIQIRARVIAATNRDLEIEVEEKRFREDLYYRINVVPISVPPLRARMDDLLLLAQQFLRRIAKRLRKPVAGISAPAARKMLDYDWPGNVRELENCMERAVALCRHKDITVDDLPAKFFEHGASRMVIDTTSPLEMITIDEMTRRYVRQVLVATSGNKTHAARVLGIDRRSLYRRLAEHDPTADVTEMPPETPPRTS
jgi:two-component system response regulator HydG